MVIFATLLDILESVSYFAFTISHAKSVNKKPESGSDTVQNKIHHKNKTASEKIIK